MIYKDQHRLKQIFVCCNKVFPRKLVGSLNQEYRGKLLNLR
jgi:hypothetical protein